MNNHSENNNETYVCPKCGSRFIDKQQHHNHIHICKGSNICFGCGSKQSRKDLLQRHVKNHCKGKIITANNTTTTTTITTTTTTINNVIPDTGIVRRDNDDNDDDVYIPIKSKSSAGFKNDIVIVDDDDDKLLRKKSDPPKRKQIPQPIRAQVWETYLGNKIKSKCPVCEENIISCFNFDCGHVIAHSRGGPSTLDNLRPLCSACNKSMGTMNMIKYLDAYGYENAKIIFLL